MVKYRTTWWGGFSNPNLERVEVIRETDSFVFVDKNRREAKRSSYTCYFDTREEAKEYLMKGSIKHIEDLKRDLLKGEYVLAFIKTL